MLSNAPIMTILPAADIDRAQAFYADTLGLPTPDMPVPGDAALFECGEGTLLYIYHVPQGTQAEHTVAGWMVQDFDTTMRDLRERGITFERYDMPNLKTDDHGVAEMDGAQVAWFKDSEGNILSITSMPA